MKPYNASPVNTKKVAIKKPTKKKGKKASVRQGSYGTKKPTNNRLVQGKSNSPWPMWSSTMNTKKTKTKGASPFTGTSGASY